MQFTVAIDGPAAAGKGTISRAVAARFGLAHLDTGALYRVVGKKMLAANAGLAEAVSIAGTLAAEDLQAEGLRTAEVAEAASQVAALPAVRAALAEFQKRFARAPGGAVLDGRDIGTVICPEAEVKLYVTASPEVRAQRRFLELTQSGQATSYAQVLADVQERDRRDMERLIAPLRPAEDALQIDTSEMSIEAAVDAACAAVAARFPA